MSETRLSETKWYVARNGVQSGPIDDATLRAQAQRGELQPGDLVWRDGMPEWLAATQVLELAGAFAPSLAGAAQPIGYYNPASVVLNYAGFWWRVLAYIIDYVITYVGAFAIAFAIGLVLVSSQVQTEIIQLIGAVVGLILGWLYYALMESSSKQATLGKMICGLVVTDETGGRISFGRATGRHFAKILSAIILCIGFIMVGLTQRKQGLHDLLAKTLVIKK